MDADHRHLCKFDTPSDPNYIMLRNALLTAVDGIRTTLAATTDCGWTASAEPGSIDVPRSAPLSQAEVNRLLRSFLNVKDFLEGDLATLRALKQPGTCQWFTDRASFTSWKSATSPRILWLMGRPAVGKSVLASHVIEQLKPPEFYCSFFIFKHSKVQHSSLSDCFRSLAYQMATHDNLARDALVQLAQDDLACGDMEEGNIWRRVFQGCLFNLPSTSRHVWVIDGVDECASFNSLFTKRFLLDLPDQLRVFATSRPLEEIERGLAALGPRAATVQTLSDTDTLADMRLYVTAQLSELGRPDDIENRARMSDKILRKSRGSFLWARLVVNGFKNAWTEEAMDEVIEEVPADLVELYSRMTQSILADKRKTTLAKSILTWVTLSARPLSTDELRCALKLDVGQTLQRAAKAIPNLCAQLVYIDQDDRVHLIHETVREYLVREDLVLDLAVNQTTGHTKLASLLLRYLCSGILTLTQTKGHQGPMGPRGFGAAASAAAAVDSPLLDYAFRYFSDHVMRASSYDDYLMESLCSFLRSNSVLDWIEHVAAAGDLTIIVRTAMNIGEYVGGRMKCMPSTPPTDQSTQLVNSWVTDLIRVAAKFRLQLLACPSSIHCLVPPLCPLDSVIFRTFVRDAKTPAMRSRLLVEGSTSSSWDDCLIRIDFQNGRTTAVCDGDRYFAIGLSTGHISLYDQVSLQCIRQMEHPERVKLMEFCPVGSLFASCGDERLVIWELKSATMAHSFSLPSSPLDTVFLGTEEILCALQSSALAKWNLQTGEYGSVSWRDVACCAGLGNDLLLGEIVKYPMTRAAFLAHADRVLLATVSCRIHPVLIWNALEARFLGFCHPEVYNIPIHALTFNPDPEIPALVVLYQDGNLCIFDYTTTELKSRRSHVYGNCLACSPDGRYLIAGTVEGPVEIFEFERDQFGNAILVPIYCTAHPFDCSITGVTFSMDGLRFVDIRGHQGRVWAPAALVRKSRSGPQVSAVRLGPEETAKASQSPRAKGMLRNTFEEPRITSPLVLSADGKIVIAGKSDGEVALFSAIDARLLSVLYRHGRGGAQVTSLTFNAAHDMIASADGSRVLVVKLEQTLSEETAALPLVRKSGVVVNRHFDPFQSIVQIILSSAGDKVLVCGLHSQQLWDIATGRVFVAEGGAAVNINGLAAGSGPTPSQAVTPAVGSPAGESGPATFRSALQHPTNVDWFVLIAGDTARIFSWTDFSELTSEAGILLPRPSRNPPKATASATYHVGPGFVLEFLRSSPTSSPQLQIWPAATLDPSSSIGTKSLQPAREPNLDAVSPNVLCILGVIGTSTILFLDVNLWVCSVELQSIGPPAQAGAPVYAGGEALRSSRTHLARVESAGFRRPGVELSSSPSALVPSAPAVQAKRHFFVLSEWRTGRGSFRCALAGLLQTSLGAVLEVLVGVAMLLSCLLLAIVSLLSRGGWDSRRVSPRRRRERGRRRTCGGSFLGACIRGHQTGEQWLAPLQW
ncbi:hypothetical protein VTK56DRAFT_8888 [Thermocarpiscus australiensis]